MNKQNFFLVYILSLSLFVFSFEAKAQDESDAQLASGPWYETYVNEAKVMAHKVELWCTQVIEQGIAYVKAATSDFDNPLQMAEDARVKLEERNVATANRAKDLQEKTGLKGEATNMDKVVESGELKYEVKDIQEVKSE